VAALPGYFAFGLQNGKGEASHIGQMPIDYRYQYLSGGFGTDGWAHWNAPIGQYVDQYLSESRVWGLIPVFTYYQIVHAQPNPNVEPPLQNLSNASTMHAYFDDWILLLNRCAADGQPVILHLEPDLFGYLQHDSPDPTKTRVMVRGSGHPSVAAFDDDARGFVRALIALRDELAPNVMLAWHASTWATGADLVQNDADPAAIADATAAYYQAIDAQRGFDLMFAEFADRNAGYMQTSGIQGKWWWSERDFDRFRAWLARLLSHTGQPAILWQVPIGNTFMRSLNNEPFHYQDNRAEYFLESYANIQQMADEAGVIAVLFGAGEEGQTTYYDAAMDGITNPYPIGNGTENLSGHDNDRPSQNEDDDGGYLRDAIANYYAAGPVPLPRWCSAYHWPCGANAGE
jgi:hypothetical protein